MASPPKLVLDVFDIFFSRRSYDKPPYNTSFLSARRERGNPYDNATAESFFKNRKV